MPAYRWSCAACGSSNNSNTETCAVCECPAISTVKQHNAYRAQLEGTGPPIRQPVERHVQPDVAKALDRIQKNIRMLIAFGAITAIPTMIAMYLMVDAATRSRLGWLAALGFLIFSGPCTLYLYKLRCPLCGSPWHARKSANKQNNDTALFPFTFWQSCAACGISTDAKVKKTDDV